MVGVLERDVHRPRRIKRRLRERRHGGFWAFFPLCSHTRGLKPWVP
jgi:hypothetical protein